MLVKVLSAHSQEDIRKLTFHVCELLDFYPSSIEIEVADTLVEGTNGMCIDLSQDEFLILLRYRDRMMHTLVHELIHAKQYMKQNLGRHLDTRSEEYETAWWEVEARKLTKQIIEKYSFKNS